MFPGRIFLGIGTGESLMKLLPVIIGLPTLEIWKVREAIRLRLWTEDWVDFRGNYYWVKIINCIPSLQSLFLITSQD